MDIILRDVKEFDPKMWMYAATISLSALVILGLTVCILLLRDHCLDMEEKRLKGKTTLHFAMFSWKIIQCSMSN